MRKGNAAYCCAVMATAALLFGSTNAAVADTDHNNNNTARLIKVKRQIQIDPTGGIIIGGGAASSSAASTSSARATTTTSAAAAQPTTTTPTQAATTPVATTPAAVTTTPAAQTTPAETAAASPTAEQTTTERATSRTTTTPGTTLLAATSSASVPVTTIIVTDSNGVTSLSTSAVALQTAAPSNSGGSSSGKTWGIVGGVVGGVVALAAIAFIVWRLSQRRFSELDDVGDEIRWPELQPDGQTVLPSTLNPPGTRRTGGAGVEMGEHESEWESKSQADDYYDSSYEKQAGYGAVPSLPQQQQQQAYYDPYGGTAYPPQRNPSPGPNALPSEQNESFEHAYEYEQHAASLGRANSVATNGPASYDYLGTNSNGGMISRHNSPGPIPPTSNGSHSPPPLGSTGAHTPPSLHGHQFSSNVYDYHGRR